MALSNYFNYDEYAMIFGYACLREDEFSDCKSLGDIIVKAVRILSSKGVKFEGVDENCNKVNYIGDKRVAMVFSDIVFNIANGELFYECVKYGMGLLLKRNIVGEKDIEEFLEWIEKERDSHE